MNIRTESTGFSPESLRLIGAALALQQVERTAANIVPIPSTGRFVVIGTPAEVARLMEVGPLFANDGREPDWEAYAAAESIPGARCPNCDGTGDVHRADGEWVGECSCGAANAPADVQHDHSEGGHHD